MKNPWHFSYITAKLGYHNKKKVNKLSIEIDEGNSKKYKIEVICDNKVYAKKAESCYLLGLYYLFL